MSLSSVHGAASYPFSLHTQFDIVRPLHTLVSSNVGHWNFHQNISVEIAFTYTEDLPNLIDVSFLLHILEKEQPF